MNSIITLKRLIDLIAKQSGQPYSTAEAFVKAFTSQVREALTAGEVVSIKGVGDFMITDDKKIVLVVDNELVSIINEPFSMFSPEELPEQTDSQAISAPASQPKPELEPASEPAQASEPESEPMPVSVPIAADSTASSEAKEAPSQPRPAEPKPQYIPWSDEDDEGDEDDEEQISATAEEITPFPYFWTMIGAAAGLIIGLCLGFFAHDPIEELLEPSLAEEAEFYSDTDTVAESTDTLAVEVPASFEEKAQEQKPQPEEAPKPKAQTQATTTTPASTPAPAATPAKTADVYETVASGVTLAKLSKKHYKSDIYWVFIYLENKDVIKNPDNVPLGAKLRIPPLSKYAPQATESERRAAAQREISKIRKR